MMNWSILISSCCSSWDETLAQANLNQAVPVLMTTPGLFKLVLSAAACRSAMTISNCLPWIAEEPLIVF